MIKPLHPTVASFLRWNQHRTNFFSTRVRLLFGRREDGNPQHDDLLCPAEQNPQTRENGEKSEVEWGIFEIGVYLLIFPRVLAATALNLSGRISILAASWPGRCTDVPRALLSCLNAHSPLSLSLPLSSLPTRTRLCFTLRWATERCRPFWSTVTNDMQLVFIGFMVWIMGICMILNIQVVCARFKPMNATIPRKQLKKTSWKYRANLLNNPQLGCGTNNIHFLQLFILWFFSVLAKVG